MCYYFVLDLILGPGDCLVAPHVFMHVVFSMVWDPSLRQILNWGVTASKKFWKMNSSFSLMKFIDGHR